MTDINVITLELAKKYTDEHGGGTTVVANPTLAGTEPSLTGLQVGDNKYKVPDPAARIFPSTWPINGSCKAFLEAIGADSNAKVGETYQGGVAFRKTVEEQEVSDLPNDMSNAEAEVEIISSTLSTNYKVIRLNIYSTTDEPFSWARMYLWSGSAEWSTLQPWQITARAADQYTVPVATGTVNKTTGAVTFNDWGLERGVYLVNVYGTQSSSQVSYTYYFAYGGYETWMTHSCDCCGTSVAALSRSLTMIRHDGQALGWDNDATIDMYKMR